MATDPQPEPIRPVPLDPTGKLGPTRGQARGPGWRQTSRGLYVPATVEARDTRQRVLEASMRLGPEGAVTGWASLLLQGAAYFDGLGPDGRTELAIPLISPDRQLRADGRTRIVLSRLGPPERISVHGIPCATAERAVFDEMRVAELREAVVVLDMACHAELTSLRRMRAFLAEHPGWRGVVLVCQAVRLADEHSRSPMETRMRLIWVLDAGLLRPLCNRPVFSRDGRLLGVPDLLDPRAGVAGEYDGADHRETDRRFRDLERETELRRHCLEYFTLVGGDLQDRPRAVRRMRDAFERADVANLHRTPDWTLEPPPGWHGFRTDIPLDDRLDLRDLVRHERECS